MVRAKTVNEVQGFERGSNPKSTMEIGKSKRIKELLDNIYGGEFEFLTYSIKSPDHIEIFYKDPDMFKDNEVRKNTKWILKYIEIDPFVLNNHKSTDTFYDTPIHTDKWSIYENYIPLHNFPKKLEVEQTLKFHVGDYSKNGVKEMAEYIVECLNKKYPKVDGFELIETIK